MRELILNDETNKNGTTLGESGAGVAPRAEMVPGKVGAWVSGTQKVAALRSASSNLHLIRVKLKPMIVNQVRCRLF